MFIADSRSRSPISQGNRALQVSANIALVKNLTLHGIFWGSYMKQNPAVLQQSIAKPLEWLAQGKITVPISHRWASVSVGFLGGVLASAVGLIIAKDSSERCRHAEPSVLSALCSIVCFLKLWRRIQLQVCCAGPQLILLCSFLRFCRRMATA